MCRPSRWHFSGEDKEEEEEEEEEEEGGRGIPRNVS